MFIVVPIDSPPRYSLAYGVANSRLIKKEYPGIKSKLWNEYFRSRSFCLISMGGAPVEVIRRYIESQNEKE